MNMIDYKGNMKKMIEFGNGVITEERFVEKPGVGILSKTELTNEGKDIFNTLNIDTSKEEYEQIGEFAGRITYNTFPSTPKDSAEYTKNMVEHHQHLSVFSSVVVTFLVAGISVETTLEFVAHHEGDVARITSSNTKAMNDCYYRVQGTEEERALQKEIVKDSIKIIKQHDAHNRMKTEFANMTLAATKTSAFSISMNIKNWHKTLIGRLSKKGNETEVREVCEIIANKLHNLYPSVIQKPEEYYELSNGEKYKMD